MNDNVARYRRSLKISQTKMAHIAGIKLSAYRYKEKGDKPFDQEEMIRIYNFLSKEYPGITIEELFFTNEVLNMITNDNAANKNIISI